MGWIHTGRESRLNRNPSAARNASSTLAACLTIAVVFYVLNASGLIAGALFPPPGYEPLFLNRTEDIAQNATWAQAYRQGGLVIANYHAASITEPALFNAYALIASRFAGLPWGEVTVNEVLRFLAHLLCGYGWFRCLMVFGKTAGERWAALLITLCSVPVLSLLDAPLAIAGSDSAPGFGAFLFLGYDGFLHALPGNIATTAATGLTLLTFALIGEFLRDGNNKRFLQATALTFLSALLHPFEAFIVLAAGGAVLVFTRNIRLAVILGLAGFAGLAPYIAAALTSDWMREASALNHFSPPPPWLLIPGLGLPTVAGLTMFLTRPASAKNDVLVSAWVLLALTLLYVPLIPWSQHLLDGYHIAIGLWVVALARTHPLPERVKDVLGARWTRIAAVLVVGASLAAYPSNWRVAFKSGSQADPPRYVSAVRSIGVRQLIDWLRANASHDDLILAPYETSWWLSTVPMHAVASHYIFSLMTEAEWVPLRSVVEGRVAPGIAGQRLETLGVRFVAVPDSQPITVDGYALRTAVGGWLVYENPTSRMKPYKPRHSE